MNFSMIVKVTKRCNLSCRYCYENFTARTMSKEMVETVIDRGVEYVLKKASLKSQSLEKNYLPGLLIYWHGGEPLIVGKDFYKHIYEYQKKYEGQVNFYNTIQTNATLLDQSWFDFFIENKQQFGISCDGPKFLHDKNRIKRGSDQEKLGSFDKVFESIELYKKNYNVKPPLLCVITKDHLKNPQEILSFFAQYSSFVRFLPYFMTDPEKDKEFCIDPDEYAHFLKVIYDEWVRSEMDLVIANFTSVIDGSVGNVITECSFIPVCTELLVSIDEDGKVYPCDRFSSTVEFLLGSIEENTIEEILDKKRDMGFRKREEELCEECEECTWLKRCYGGCTFNAWSTHKNFSSPDYYCRSYKALFEHIDKSVNEELERAKVEE